MWLKVYRDGPIKRILWPRLVSTPSSIIGECRRFIKENKYKRNDYDKVVDYISILTEVGNWENRLNLYLHANYFGMKRLTQRSIFKLINTGDLYWNNNDCVMSSINRKDCILEGHLYVDENRIVKDLFWNSQEPFLNSHLYLLVYLFQDNGITQVGK